MTLETINVIPGYKKPIVCPYNEYVACKKKDCYHCGFYPPVEAFRKSRIAEKGVKTMSEWISVKDRLPEEFVSILVYMPDEAPMPTVREGYLTECGFMVPALLQHIPVTHWRPLPEPPKEV